MKTHTDLKKKLPAIVLREWSETVDDGGPVMLLKVFLTVDCKIIGLRMEPEKGLETKAAIAALKLGKLGVE